MPGSASFTDGGETITADKSSRRRAKVKTFHKELQDLRMEAGLLPQNAREKLVSDRIATCAYSERHAASGEDHERHGRQHRQNAQQQSTS